MFKRKKVTVVPILLLVALFLVACAMTQQNRYQQNLTIEAEIAAVMEQYDVWYQMMTPEIQAQWTPIFQPAFEQLDLLMDSYHNMLANDLETMTILAEINRLKTRIMIELTKRMAESEAAKEAN